MILLYRGKSALSRLIEWQTDSVYSHASWYDIETNTEYEAWKSGVTASTGIGRLHTPRTVVDVFEPDTAGMAGGMWERVRDFLRGEVGAPYDWRGVLRFVSRWRKAPPPEAWFCSELVFAALKAAGFDVLSRIEAWRVTPAMLSYSPRLRYFGQVITPRDDGGIKI